MHLTQSPFKINLLLLAFSCLTIQHTWGQIAPRPAGRAAYREEEYPTTTYTPNVYHNQLTSPGYRMSTRSASKVQTSYITTVQVNVNAQQQNIIGDAACEPNIAIDLGFPNEIAMGWRQFDDVNNSFRQAGFATSTDNGDTWDFHGAIEPGIFRSDPVLDVDADGEFYYNSLTLDSLNNYSCQVFKSTDAGNSWDAGVTIGGGDKQWMAIDRTAGPGQGNVYSVWTTSFSYCQPGQFTRSSNGGASYESCTGVDGDPYWSNMAVGNNGELYIAGVSATTGEFVVTKSTNAGTPGSLIGWNAVPVNMGGYLTGWTSINPVGLIGQANIDVDRSNGPGRDNIYVLASVTTSTGQDTADVMFARSTDGGQTWSAPMRINDDASATNFQWFGTMSVAPTGRIDAIWLDTRDGLGTHASALYYSYSTDQGNTWTANQKMSDSFDPHLGYPQQQKLGDYFDMISDEHGAHLAWANTLNGEQDVYYSYIVPAVAIGTAEAVGAQSVKIWPNPTAGKLRVQSTGDLVHVVISNIWGAKVFASRDYQASHAIDISALPAGIYFLQSESQSGAKETHKIIRQ